VLIATMVVLERPQRIWTRSLSRSWICDVLTLQQAQVVEQIYGRARSLTRRGHRGRAGRMEGLTRSVPTMDSWPDASARSCKQERTG